MQWFRENQQLLDDSDKQRETEQRELVMLRNRVKQQEEDMKKLKDYEKKCKLLEETIKSKNPNSIPMLI